MAPEFDRVKLVYAPEQCGFSRPRTPDDAENLPLLHIEGDAAQRMELAEVLVHVTNRHQRRGTAAAHRLTRPRAKRRSSGTCSTVSADTTIRYQMPATNSNSMTRELA